MMPSDRHRKNTINYLQGEVSSDDGYSRSNSARRGYNPKLQRGISETSLVRREKEGEEKDENEWDTDYDPKDKYYLSNEDDPFDPPSIGRRSSPRREHSSRDRESARKHHSPRHASPSRNSHAGTHSHGHIHHHSDSRPHTRDNKEDDKVDRHKSKPHSKPASTATRPRPGPSRASSSYLNAVRRPRVNRAGSSNTTSRTRTRPRPSRGVSHTSRQARSRSGHDGVKFWDRFHDIDWEEAAKVALQAGTVAAVKVGADPIPWTVKGTKIASAALGAAVVDHVLQPKKKKGVKYAAMKHLTEVAVGSMLVGPALGKVEEKRKR